MQAGAAGKASDAAQKAAAQDLAFTKQVYGDTTANLQPTINQGNAAGSELSGLLGTGGNAQASNDAFNKYLGSTNYQFQLGQGENAVKSANAASFNSGATAKALNNYAQGQAGSALSGYEGLLQGQQSLGANSALGLGGIGTQTSQQVSNANNYGANAAGLGAIGSANANSNALTGLAGLVNKAATQSSFSGGGTGGSAFSAPWSASAP